MAARHNAPNAATAPTRRADVLLVERGLFESRAQAQAAISAGTVRVDSVVLRKASIIVPVTAAIDAKPAHPYVSRGGVKLAHALAQSGIPATGRICLDVGASTGGFSQVLLDAGARLVYAVDVGTSQLRASLCNDSRIVSIENTDIRAITPARFPTPPDLAVIDVSFIGLRQIVPSTLALLARLADLIMLVKPQFEAGRGKLKKGVVRDEAVHACVVASIVEFLASVGCQVTGQFPSPILGGDGNREFFVTARRA